MAMRSAVASRGSFRRYYARAVERGGEELSEEHRNIIASLERRSNQNQNQNQNGNNPSRSSNRRKRSALASSELQHSNNEDYSGDGAEYPESTGPFRKLSLSRQPKEYARIFAILERALEEEIPTLVQRSHERAAEQRGPGVEASKKNVMEYAEATGGYESLFSGTHLEGERSSERGPSRDEMQVKEATREIVSSDSADNLEVNESSESEAEQALQVSPVDDNWPAGQKPSELEAKRPLNETSPGNGHVGESGATSMAALLQNLPRIEEPPMDSVPTLVNPASRIKGNQTMEAHQIEETPTEEININAEPTQSWSPLYSDELEMKEPRSLAGSQPGYAQDPSTKPESIDISEPPAPKLPWQYVQLEELRQRLSTLNVSADPVSDVAASRARIHVLGVTNNGKYIAQALLKNGVHVTYLIHRPLVMQEWADQGLSIKFSNDQETFEASGFHVESAAGFERRDPSQRFVGFGEKLQITSEPPESIIENLIVAIEPQFVVAALRRIQNRLSSASTICFVGESLGVAHEICRRMFPDPENRPNFIMANISHQLDSTGEWDVQEEKSGSLSLTKLPQFRVHREEGGPLIREADHTWPATSQALVAALLRAPELKVSATDNTTFHIEQLRTVAAQAVIGPLTVAFDCAYDDLLYNYRISQYMYILQEEIHRVINNLPEVIGQPHVQYYFKLDRLEKDVVYKIRASMRPGQKVISKMLRKTRNGERSDIDYTTGYLLRRAKSLGMEMPANEALMRQVQGKMMINSRIVQNYIPWENKDPR